MDRDRHIKRLIAAVLGMALGAMLCLAIDLHAKEATEQHRVKYAAIVENMFLEEGYQLSVTPHGFQNRELTFVCEDFVDGEIVKNLIADSVAEWKFFGFKYITFTTGKVMMIIDVNKAYDISVKKEKM